MQEAKEAAAEHAIHSMRLFRPRADAGAQPRRRIKKRVKTYKLGVALDTNQQAFGLQGWSAFQISEEQLRTGMGAKRWPYLGVVSDLGPDCLCLRNFLRSDQHRLVDLWFDPNHGGHHSCQHGMDRSGLRFHSATMTFAYNVGLGEWKDGSRREQVLTSITDTMNSTDVADDVVFRKVSAAMRLEYSCGESASGQELRRAFAAENCWHQSETGLI